MENVKDELIQAMFRLKKMLNNEFGKDNQSININMSEYILLREIESNSIDNYNPQALTEARKYLSVSKAAISQMLNSLEKKGYIYREIDLNNRRNLIVILTDEGRRVFELKNKEFYDRFEIIINDVGTSDILEFVKVINKINNTMSKYEKD